jgi:hypothetical protein
MAINKLLELSGCKITTNMVVPAYQVSRPLATVFTKAWRIQHLLQKSLIHRDWLLWASSAKAARFSKWVSQYCSISIGAGVTSCLPYDQYNWSLAVGLNCGYLRQVGLGNHETTITLNVPHSSKLGSPTSPLTRHGVDTQGAGDFNFYHPFESGNWARKTVGRQGMHHVLALKILSQVLPIDLREPTCCLNHFSVWHLACPRSTKEYL